MTCLVFSEVVQGEVLPIRVDLADLWAAEACDAVAEPVRSDLRGDGRRRGGAECGAEAEPEGRRDEPAGRRACQAGPYEAEDEATGHDARARDPAGVHSLLATARVPTRLKSVGIQRFRLESNVREAYLSEQPVAVESSDREHA